ncbi:hypothetical protein CWI26_01190 [Streptococcus suis]|uniref:Uncharacterized protein n=1 Tax=Streptococcus suis TaxID=1307 RepID=A0A2I5KLJ5_STRSU|nr:hypothetical protein CWI26_01190 [Streptococcus suis]
MKSSGGAFQPVTLKQDSNRVLSSASFPRLFLIFIEYNTNKFGAKSTVPLLRVRVNIPAQWLIGFNSPVDC